MRNPDVPFVSVIIPVYRQWGQLTLALDALKDQTYPTPSFEILVVNNEPSPQSPPVMPDLSNLVILNEARAGSYAARNTGIRASRGKILAFTDSDCITAPDWLEQAVKTFGENPGMARVAGAIEILYRDPEKRTSVELWTSLFGWRQELAVSQYGSALTANLFTYREIFDKVGLFDETLRSGGDSEWGIRAARAGYRIVFAPNVRVFHPARKSLPELAQKTARLYGGTWERAQGSGPRNFLQRAGIFRVGTEMLRTTLATPKLTSLTDRFKVLGVIAFVGIVRLFEHIRLLLGGRPKRA